MALPNVSLDDIDLSALKVSEYSGLTIEKIYFISDRNRNEVDSKFIYPVNLRICFAFKETS